MPKQPSGHGKLTWRKWHPRHGYSCNRRRKNKTILSETDFAVNFVYISAEQQTTGHWRQYKTGRFRGRNGPFDTMKRPVSDRKTVHYASLWASSTYEKWQKISQKFTNRGITSLKNDSLKQRVTDYAALRNMTFCSAEMTFCCTEKHTRHTEGRNGRDKKFQLK